MKIMVSLIKNNRSLGTPITKKTTSYLRTLNGEWDSSFTLLTIKDDDYNDREGFAIKKRWAKKANGIRKSPTTKNTVP